jgi:predicted ribosomally synthesized peptide with SipW-like signal peptide
MTRNRDAASRGASVSRLARRLGGAAGVTAAAVVVAVISAGGTYALWNASAEIDAGTINTGNTGLTINDVTSYAIVGLDTGALYPGYSTITPTPLTVKNTGTTPLSVTPGAVTFTDSSSALASQLVVAVRHTATCTPTPTGSTPVPFTSFTLQPGATTLVCVEVQLKSTAPANVQGLSLGFTAPLNGLQVRP